jgi:S1-C subfamily serine protease
VSLLLLLLGCFAPVPFAHPTPGYLGAEFVRNKNDLTIEGVFISSPAAVSGLTSGNVIVALEGTKVSTRDELGAFLRKKRPGDEVTLTVQRGSESVALKVKLGAPVRAHLGVWFLGTTLQIGNLIEGSAAEKAGLHANDTFVAIDGKKLATQQALIALLAAKKPGTAVTFTIQRNNAEMKVKVILGKRPGY